MSIHLEMQSPVSYLSFAWTPSSQNPTLRWYILARENLDDKDLLSVCISLSLMILSSSHLSNLLQAWGRACGHGYWSRSLSSCHGHANSSIVCLWLRPIWAHDYAAFSVSWRGDRSKLAAIVGVIYGESLTGQDDSSGGTWWCVGAGDGLIWGDED